MNASNPSDSAVPTPQPPPAPTDVGVRELKARLSHYLDLASQGVPIRITDRGVPKAMLTPLQGESRIEQGIREGWISVGPNVGRPHHVRRGRPATAERSTTDLIREDRDA